MTEVISLVATGGQLLAPVAATAANYLTRNWVFRWRVWRRVHKRAPEACKGRTYRRWLRTISQDELATAVEDVQPALAKRLDDAATARDNTWSSRADHLSIAMRLVEYTYPAIAAALGDADRTAASEAWAAQRSVSLRAQLVELAGPDAALSRADYAAVLAARSDARRAVRLQAFDLDTLKVSELLNSIKPPVIPSSGLAVLTGEFGSGKSETAETWHRANIRRYETSALAAVPIWVTSHHAQDSSLIRVLDELAGSRWRRGGAAIVLDGLDEVDPLKAQHLVNDARVLVRTHEGVQVLITARPGVVTAASLSDSPHEDQELLQVERLSVEQATDLVQKVTGKEVDRWRWTAEMAGTLTRPFFALAACVMYRSNTPPRSEVDLIQRFVEHALTRPSEYAAVSNAQVRETLVRLAIQLTSSGHSSVGIADRQVALGSRLVTHAADGEVVFSLPIFQQWFASEALLDEVVDASAVIGGPAEFGRWRWAAAVALSRVDSDGQADRLVSTWVAGNPGAASWIIGEASRGKEPWLAPSTEPLNPETSGARYLRAVRTWATALGPAARRLLPRQVVEGPVEFGIGVSGRSLTVTRAAAAPQEDTVVELPPREHVFVDPDRSERWESTTSYGSVPSGPTWPWVLVQQRLAHEMLDKLNTDPYLGAPDGIWAQERRYFIAQELTTRTPWRREPVEAAQVLESLAEIEQHSPLDSLWKFQSRHSSAIAGSELRELRAWCEANSEPIRSPLPPPDFPPEKGRWIWDDYSPQRLMEFEVEAYGHGCVAYDEALATHFASFSWSMASTPQVPLGVAMTLHVRDEPGSEGRYGIGAIRVPMTLLEAVAEPTDESVWSSTGRAVITTVASSKSRDNEALHRIWQQCEAELSQHPSPFGPNMTSSTFGPRNVRDPRPASAVAARWLWNDFKRLNLGDGTFPQLQ